MNQYIFATKNYLSLHKTDFIIGTSVLVAIALLVTIFIYNVLPHYQYQPISACNVFTPLKAEDLLGNKVIDVGEDSPTVDGDVATSQCSYSDTNPVEAKLIVAALAVRSAVNDAGIKQNTAQFVSGTPTSNVETVKNLGDKAYFNETLGQLNVLKGRVWYLISYGVGSAPQNNTLTNAVKFAHLILK